MTSTFNLLYKNHISIKKAKVESLEITLRTVKPVYKDHLPLKTTLSVLWGGLYVQVIL